MYIHISFAQQSCGPADACMTPLTRTHSVRELKEIGARRDQQRAKATQTEAKCKPNENHMGASGSQMAYRR